METKITTINGIEMIGFPVADRGTTRTVYVQQKDLDELAVKVANRMVWHFDYKLSCYDETGKRLMGVWKHGRNGSKRYTEPVSLDVRDNTFVGVRDYHYGGIRPSLEYLCRVIWN